MFRVRNSIQFLWNLSKSNLHYYVHFSFPVCMDVILVQASYHQNPITLTPFKETATVQWLSTLYLQERFTRTSKTKPSESTGK